MVKIPKYFTCGKCRKVVENFKKDLTCPNCNPDENELNTEEED